MDTRDATFQELLSRQIRIRDLQGRWHRVSNLSMGKLEKLWDETVSVVRDWEKPVESFDKSDRENSLR